MTSSSSLKRPRAPRRLASSLGVLAASLAFFGAAGTASAACANAAADPQVIAEPTVEAVTLCLLNDERRQVGRPALRSNGKLALAAERHAEDMGAKGYFAHDSLDGRSFLERIKAAGYLSGRPASWSVGENIAWGTGRLATPSEIVDAWMTSPGHKRNILSAKFREIGLGLANGGSSSSMPDRTIYATEFGVRR